MLPLVPCSSHPPPLHPERSWPAHCQPPGSGRAVLPRLQAGHAGQHRPATPWRGHDKVLSDLATTAQVLSRDLPVNNRDRPNRISAEFRLSSHGVDEPCHPFPPDHPPPPLPRRRATQTRLHSVHRCGLPGGSNTQVAPPPPLPRGRQHRTPRRVPDQTCRRGEWAGGEGWPICQPCPWPTRAHAVASSLPYYRVARQHGRHVASGLGSKGFGGGGEP